MENFRIAKSRDDDGFAVILLTKLADRLLSVSSFLRVGQVRAVWRKGHAPDRSLGRFHGDPLWQRFSVIYQSPNNKAEKKAGRRQQNSRHYRGHPSALRA